MACNHSVLLFGQYSVCLDVINPASSGNRLRAAQAGRAPGHSEFDPAPSDAGAGAGTGTGDAGAPARTPIHDTGFCLSVDGQLRLSNALFFVIAIGVAAVWGSMSSAVSVWAEHGDAVWPVMVAVYNAIGLPFLFLQLRYDSDLDKRLTPYNAYWSRMVSSLAMLTVVAFALPSLAGDGDSAANGGGGSHGASVAEIIVATAFVGIAVAGAYTWLFQLATFFHARSVAWALGGVGMTSIIFLFVLIAKHFEFNADTLPSYWRVTQALTTCGLLCTCVLLLLPISKQLLAGDTKHTLRERLIDGASDADAAAAADGANGSGTGAGAKASPSPKPKAKAYKALGGGDESSATASINAAGNGDGSGSGEDSKRPAPVEPGGAVALVVSDPGEKLAQADANANAKAKAKAKAKATTNGSASDSAEAEDRAVRATVMPVSTMELVKRGWQLEVSALLINLTVVGLAAAVTSLPHKMSSGQLSTLLLVIGGLAGFIGNELTVFLQSFKTPRTLLIAVLARMVVFALMFVYALSGLFVNDLVPVLLLAVLGLSGGYCNGRAYVLAASLSDVSEEKRRMSTLISLFEYVGVYFGIAFAFTVRAIIGA